MPVHGTARVYKDIYSADEVESTLILLKGKEVEGPAGLILRKMDQRMRTTYPSVGIK